MTVLGHTGKNQSINMCINDKYLWWNRMHFCRGVRIPLGFPLLDSNPRFIALLNDHQQFRRETFERLRGSPSWGFPSLGLTGQRRSRERHRSHHRPRGVEHSSSPTPPPPSGGLNVVSDTANNNHSDNNNTPLHDNASWKTYLILVLNKVCRLFSESNNWLIKTMLHGSMHPPRVF